MTAIPEELERFLSHGIHNDLNLYSKEYINGKVSKNILVEKKFKERLF
jgi:hypothetical protein